MLKKLLSDPEVTIRKEALLASGKLASPTLLDSALEALRHPSTRDAAAKALREGGDASLPIIERGLADVSFPKAGRVKLARVCGNIRRTSAKQVLLKFITVPENDVRSAVFSAVRRWISARSRSLRAISLATSLRRDWASVFIGTSLSSSADGARRPSSCP